RLDASPAENALIGVIAIKRVRIVDYVWLRSIGNVLTLNRQQLGGVVDGAVTVAVVANRAVENVIAENPVKRFLLSSDHVAGFRVHVDSGRNSRGACPHK